MVERMVAYLDSNRRAAAMVLIMDDERVDAMALLTASTKAEAMAFF